MVLHHVTLQQLNDGNWALLALYPVMGNYTLPSLRLSATADRPLTLFGAHGFTPELSDAQGWDTEVYPLTATYTFGVTIDF